MGRKLKAPDWILVDTSKKPARVRCDRCLKEEEIKLPAAIRDFCRQLEQFGEAHRTCPDPVEGLESGPYAARPWRG